MNRLVSQLDRRLNRRGDTVTLRRYYGSGATRTSRDFAMPAKVKGLVAEQLIGAITVQTFLVILSPTRLIKDGWPHEPAPVSASALVATGSLAQVPTTNDKVVIRGKERAISRAVPVFEGDACLRIELTATG